MTVDQGGRYSYGLGIDNSGNLWNATWENNTLDKINSNGTLAAVTTWRPSAPGLAASP